MLDQHPQVAPRAGAARAFEQQRVDPGIDEIIFERVIVLEIDFAAPLRDLVERRLGDVEMPVLDDLGHLAIEEGEQQRADVRAVDVGRSEEHTSELQSLMRSSYAVFCLK